MSDNLNDFGKWIISFSALGRLQNNKIPHLQPNFTMCVSINMYKFKIFVSVSMGFGYYSGKLDLTQFLLLLRTYYQNFT